MKFFEGLHSDNHPSDQPENTYRDAWNILINRQKGAVENELGNIQTSFLPEGYVVIGKAFVPDGRIIVFSTKPYDLGSEIGIVGRDGKYRTLANDDRLNFSVEHPISATVRMLPKRFMSEEILEPDQELITDTLSMGEQVEAS